MKGKGILKSNYDGSDSLPNNEAGDESDQFETPNTILNTSQADDNDSISTTDEHRKDTTSTDKGNYRDENFEYDYEDCF